MTNEDSSAAAQPLPPPPHTPAGVCQKSSSSSKLWEGIAGTTNGSFFRAATWVDPSKPAGWTSQSPSMERNPKWIELLTGIYIVYSPNLIWLAIALSLYVLFPYDYSVSKEWNSEFGVWIAKRAVLNFSVTFAFYGYWHVALYGLRWAKRPYNTTRRYRFGKVAHNVYYFTLGVLQWTFWEALFVHSYATGRLPYVPDEAVLRSWSGVAQFVAWFAAVPIFREVHFYFAHRLIHLRALYRYIHSLHHRNTDVEPFSGICMHPIEHMLYFTSVAPSLYFYATPFAFFWNGIHLILSPSGSHSGYEDHWNADQYHYLHHRYFECNYGTPTFLLDYMFGTFRDKFADKSDTYRGEGEGVGHTAALVHDAKASLTGGLPDWDQVIYNILFCVVTPIVLLEALLSGEGERRLKGSAHKVASVVTLGPVVGAILLLFVSSAKSRRGRKKFDFRRELSYPFHKESVAGSLGLHLVFGFLFSVVPAYHLVHMALAEPGEGAYFFVRRMLGMRL